MENTSEDLIEKLDRSINKTKSEFNQKEFTQRCNNIITNIKSIEKEVKDLQKLYNTQNKIINNQKKEKRITHLTKKVIVPKQICSLINVPEGTEMSKPQITKSVYNYFKVNNLYYDKDKRVLRVDSVVSSILNISLSVNDSINPKDKDGLNIYNIQRYISKLYD